MHCIIFCHPLACVLISSMRLSAALQERVNWVPPKRRRITYKERWPHLPPPEFLDGSVLVGKEQNEADLPTADDWLSPNEQALLNVMRFAGRRSDWRLGRWTAKNALALYFMYLNLPADSQLLATIEIRPASTGAPEAYFATNRRRPLFR